MVRLLFRFCLCMQGFELVSAEDLFRIAEFTGESNQTFVRISIASRRHDQQWYVEVRTLRIQHRFWTLVNLLEDRSTLTYLLLRDYSDASIRRWVAQILREYRLIAREIREFRWRLENHQV